MAAYPSALEPDSIFARDFKVVRGLRLGGMGAVYIVTQLSTGKQRALKLLASQLVNNAEMRERFVREARAAAQIESDHVVEIVTAGVDEDTGTPFIAMELLRGEELADAVDRRGAFPLGEVREVLAQVGHALEQAHAQRIVHRDLKPENIFLARPKRRGASFTAKLLDFGVAKFLALGASELGTTPVGSPLFMAPEQTDSFGNICPATDVWALGLLAFYLLTGRHYWLGAEKASVPVLLREVCLDPLARASDRAAELSVVELIPPGFDDWFDRCVVREIDDRYTEAGEAVRAFLAAVPDAAPPSRFPEPLSEPPPSEIDDAGPALELAIDEEGSLPPPADPPGGLWFEPTPDLPSDAEPPTGGSMWLDAPADAADAPAEAPEGGGFWDAARTSAPETEPSATDGAPEPSSFWFSAQPSDGDAEAPRDDASNASSLWGEAPAEPEAAASSMWGEAPAEPEPAASSLWGEAPPEPEVASPDAAPSSGAREPSTNGDRATPSALAHEVSKDTASAPKWKRIVTSKRARLVALGVALGAIVGGAVGLGTRGAKAPKATEAAKVEPAVPLEPALRPAPPSPCPKGALLVSPSGVSPYCLDRNEVAVGAYEKCVASSACEELEAETDYPPVSERLVRAYRDLCNVGARRAAYPVNCVDWWTASTYCHWASGRLATEIELDAAEKENPAPPDDKKPHANRCGDECLDWGLHFAMFIETDSKEYDGWMGSSPVGSFAHGTKQLFADLDGNVAEWTLTSAEGAAGDHERKRVVRGPAFMPLPYRAGTAKVEVGPSARSHAIGFRCAYAPSSIDEAPAHGEAEAEEVKPSAEPESTASAPPEAPAPSGREPGEYH